MDKIARSRGADGRELSREAEIRRHPLKKKQILILFELPDRLIVVLFGEDTLPAKPHEISLRFDEEKNARTEPLFGEGGEEFQRRPFSKKDTEIDGGVQIDERFFSHRGLRVGFLTIFRRSPL